MTDRTLRERCIEAMNEQVDLMAAESDVGWNPNTAPLFDAVLGVLTEHADEWHRAAKNHLYGPRWATPERLLAVLEEPR